MENDSLFSIISWKFINIWKRYDKKFAKILQFKFGILNLEEHVILLDPNIKNLIS